VSELDLREASVGLRTKKIKRANGLSGFPESATWENRVSIRNKNMLYF
jgi:hypothetical protein